MGGIRTVVRINENTPIFDKQTGKRIPYETYQQLIKTNSNQYHAVPIFNEYGEASAYSLRAATPEEQTTHQFNDRDLSQRPKVGDAMPEFVMKGIDNKEYKLSDLKGRVIVLSFWISLRRPFWGPKQAQDFADVLRPFRSETDPISLGILQATQEEIENIMSTTTLPFVAVPNSYGFHQKFQVTTSPSFIVIDRKGNVAAYLEGFAYNELRSVLQKVTK